MLNNKITELVEYIGVDDKTIDLFESQYVVPQGVSYNSYLIRDEKTALMDSSDARTAEQWLGNLEAALGGRELDYIVCLHMEPDHSGALRMAAEKYPNARIVGNAKTFSLMSRFFDMDTTGRQVMVSEGESLSLGRTSLTFYMAPMVHWPEVMVAYEAEDKILFSADAFGRFGTPEDGQPWLEEARRYYYNIVGKYGPQVQALLKKAAGLNIAMICPLHGPVLPEDIAGYVAKYDLWSRYEPEEKGVVIACASIHGNTMRAAELLRDRLTEKGVKAVLYDLDRADLSLVAAEAFRYDRLVLAAATYDTGLFTPMDSFLHRLKAKNFQKRRVGLIENGSWAPMAAKLMKETLAGFREIELCEPTVTVPSAPNAETIAALDELAQAMTK